MTELLRFLADHCGFLFDAGRFRFVDSSAESQHGAAMVLLESTLVRFRFVFEKGQVLFEFQPKSKPSREWFSQGLLRGVRLGDRGASEVMDAEWALFLAENIDFLEWSLVDADRADELVSQLKDQARLRAKALFG